jgi:anti-anti-sigma regulatory factor
VTALARRSGRLDGAGPPQVSDHAALAYGTDADCAAIAVQWLLDGLELGQRGMYVAEGSTDELAAELRAAPPLTAALERGAVVVASSTDLYDLSTPIDAAAQLALYAGAVDQASADGYRGLRVVADITPLVEDRGRRDAHLRWEQIADRYIADHPLAPACLYDTRRVRDIDPIVCAHPLQGPAPSQLAVYGVGPGRAVLEGEVDTFGARLLGQVLAGLPATDRAVDLGRLSFVDGHAAWVVHEELRRRRDAGQDLVLTGASPTVRRIWDACGFDPSLLEVA